VGVALGAPSPSSQPSSHSGPLRFAAPRDVLGGHRQRPSHYRVRGLSRPVQASGDPPSRPLLGPIKRITPGVPEDGNLLQEVELVR
jgi:hypothetical protein